MNDIKVKRSVQFLSMEKTRDLIKKTISLKFLSSIKRTYNETLTKTLPSFLFGTIGKSRFNINKASKKHQNLLILLLKNAKEDDQQFTVKTLNCKSTYQLLLQFVTHFNYHREHKL